MRDFQRFMILLVVPSLLASADLVGQEQDAGAQLDRMEQRIETLKEQRRQIIEQVEQMRAAHAERSGIVRPGKDAARASRMDHLPARKERMRSHDRDQDHRLPGRRGPGLPEHPHHPARHGDNQYDRDQGAFSPGKQRNRHEYGSHFRWTEWDHHRTPPELHHAQATAERQRDHLHHAHEHAMAAGLYDIARQISEHRERLQRQVDEAERALDRSLNRMQEVPDLGMPGGPRIHQTLLRSMRRLHAGLKQLREEVRALRDEVEELEDEIDGDDDEEDDDDEDENEDDLEEDDDR